VKGSSVFRCQACGFQTGKWYGRCPDCGEFNTMVEERTAAAPADYAAYRKQVPALVPYRGRYGAAPAAHFDWQVFRSNREWRASGGCALLLALFYAKMLWG